MCLLALPKSDVYDANTVDSLCICNKLFCVRQRNAWAFGFISCVYSYLFHAFEVFKQNSTVQLLVYSLLAKRFRWRSRNIRISDERTVSRSSYTLLDFLSTIRFFAHTFKIVAIQVEKSVGAHTHYTFAEPGISLQRASKKFRPTTKWP